VGWLIFTSVSQTVTLRVEEFLDALGASPGVAARALDAWVLLPIAAIGFAYAFAHGRRSRADSGWRPSAFVAVATLFCAVFFFANSSYLLHRFSPVREAVLYRSAQMGEATLRGSLERYGIRTLLVLRNSNEVRERESRLAESVGVRFVYIRMDETEDGVERFLEVVGDANNHPILAHCRHGIARTGVVSAVFRMEYDDWENTDALAEARRIGGYDTFGEGSKKREFILSYEPRSG
jgi:protein tyrosine phosphatase (PTP) superfamily phosphohydrolase (DUF442 family)